jgi:hypothetical protein
LPFHDAVRLKRDEIGFNRHRALALCLSMIPRVEPEGMLFRIMLEQDSSR